LRKAWSGYDAFPPALISGRAVSHGRLENDVEKGHWTHRRIVAECTVSYNLDVSAFFDLARLLPTPPAIIHYCSALGQWEETMAGISLLVIEDDTIRRELLATKLRQNGFTVVVATDGNEALNRLCNGSIPDIILLDMLIPAGHGDGWWFLKQRSRMPALVAIPIVITTSLPSACEE
jgi:CheY-like chemotaxis protein